jgi:hypothetical protein
VHGMSDGLDWCSFLPWSWSDWKSGVCVTALYLH